MNSPGEGKGERGRDEVLAGEYVLGVLPEAARREVELRIASDKAFATMVSRWESNLSGFNQGLGPEIALAPNTLAEIERQFFASSFATRPGSLWDSLTFWRGATLFSLAAALLMLLALPGALWTPQADMQVQIGELDANAGGINLAVSYDRGPGMLMLKPAAGAVAHDKSLQLWAIDGSAPPRSLGLVEEGAVNIPRSMRAAFEKGVTLEVTLEPFGGSKTGAPGETVLARGKAVLPANSANF